MKCFNKAIELSPLSFKALYNRGKNRLKIDESELALTDLIKASEQKPRHASCHEYLSEAYAAIGNLERADKHYQIAQQLRESKNKDK